MNEDRTISNDSGAGLGQGERKKEIDDIPSSSSSSGQRRNDGLEKHLAKTGKEEKPADEDEQEAELDEEDFGTIPGTGHQETEDATDREKPPSRPLSIIDRVLSRTSARGLTPGPPPDGGWRAWSAAVFAHLVIMNTWGIINSFGTFQTYYTTLLNRPPSDIAWIGSLQVFLLFFIGTFSGRLSDAGYFRALLAVGSVLQLVGVFTTAQGTKYWHFILSQGITLGIASGCLFCPTLATTSTYFSKRRSLAIGIAASGSATGGVIFPIVVRQLLPKIGFAWTMRTIGLIELVSLFAVNLGLRQRLPPRRSGHLVEWGAFKEAPYTFYAIGSFMSFWGLYIAFFYVASYSRDIIGLSYTDSLNLLLVLNGVGVIGRIVPNYMADKFGALNMFVIVGLYATIGAFSWIAVHKTASLYVWCVFYGLAAGGVQSLFPAGLTSLTTDLSKAGVRMGMVFTINSFATLTGPPIVGAMISAANGSYIGAQVFTGTTILVGTLSIAAARFATMRRLRSGWNVKV